MLTPKTDDIKWQRTFALFQLFVGLAVTGLIAGIVVPSLVRSAGATREGLAVGSLHAIKIAGFTFLFTYKNLVVAVLGLLIGGAAALVMEVERARAWLCHAYDVLRVCLEDWGFGVTGGRSASAYTRARMSRQSVPVVQNIRLATVREAEADRWVA
jgi:hypothetical protein